MEREIDVGIYDSYTGTCCFDYDWRVCGRDAFTNDLYALSINKDAKLLILDDCLKGDGILDDSIKCKSKEGLEFDKAKFIDATSVYDIVNGHMEEVKKEKSRYTEKIDSLKKARDNVSNLSDWFDFDRQIDEWEGYVEGELSKTSQEMFLKCLYESKREVIELNLECNSKAASCAYVPPRDPISPDKALELHRYYLVVLFRD